MPKASLVTLLFLLTLFSLSAKEKHTKEVPAAEAKQKTVMGVSSVCKTYYPDRMGLSPNESLLSMFQTIPGLMSVNDNGLSEKVSLKVDNETHIYDVEAVLRRIRVMDVDRIEIVNTPDAKRGTASLNVAVSVFLKKQPEGFHGNVALDCNTNRTIDPTMNFGWEKGRWSIAGGASFYFDRSETFTIQKQEWLKDESKNESVTQESEKADSYAEAASLRVRYKVSDKDRLSLSYTQDYMKVKTWTSTTVDTLLKEDYSKEKRHTHSVRLGYSHNFAKQTALNVSLSAKFQNNPRLYNYQNFGIKKQGEENTNSRSKNFCLDVTQTLPLWKNARLYIGEKLENGIVNDLTKVKIGSDDTYYDIISLNSQTKAQIDWKLDKWMFELGEVVDFFHYDIAITSLPDRSNQTIAPQTYVSVSYSINPKNMLHASYRTGVTRPNYKQIYPVVTAMDANRNPTLQDSVFRQLNNAKMHTFNAGHVFNGNSVSVSTNFKTIIVNDKLTRVKNVWMNSEKNYIYRLYSTVVWSPSIFSTALSVSANLLSYKSSELVDLSSKVSFDVRWMGICNFNRGWCLGLNLQYNGPVWDAYSKIDHYVYADAHVTKTIKNWSFNVCMNDIFDMQVKSTKRTDEMFEEISEERDYRGLSFGVSYKF